MSVARVKWLGEADIAVDVDATRALAARIAERNQQTAPAGFAGCDCAECRNLALSFDERFPESLKKPLTEIGIDWKQPLEAARLVCHEAERAISHACEFFFVGHAPPHLHFVSSGGDYINITGEDPRFGGLLRQLHGSDSAFGNISIDFPNVPWLLQEPFPEYD
ncbi:MAG: hypothetical protein ACFCBV_12465 [Phycisphaerales bacterium]